MDLSPIHYITILDSFSENANRDHISSIPLTDKFAQFGNINAVDNLYSFSDLCDA